MPFAISKYARFLDVGNMVACGGHVAILIFRLNGYSFCAQELVWNFIVHYTPPTHY